MLSLCSMTDRIRVGTKDASRCACGGWIYAAPFAVERAVVEHRKTEQHRAWDVVAWREALSGQAAE